MIIKIFEEFSDDQFEKIEYKEFLSIIKNCIEFVPFTDKEKEEILKFNTFKEERVSLYYTFPLPKGMRIYLRVNNINILIYKFTDEWFYVHSNECFRCDELKGLINCIKYLINK